MSAMFGQKGGGRAAIVPGSPHVRRRRPLPEAAEAVAPHIGGLRPAPGPPENTCGGVHMLGPHMKTNTAASQRLAEPRANNDGNRNNALGMQLKPQDIESKLTNETFALGERQLIPASSGAQQQILH